MQYDRQPDGTDKPLKQTGVDTGMGLERLCAVVQDKDSVYDTDIFLPIITSNRTLTGITYASAPEHNSSCISACLLTTYVLQLLLLQMDAPPSNEGRGYVLRKIIRRAALFAQKLSNKIFSLNLLMR